MEQNPPGLAGSFGAGRGPRLLSGGGHRATVISTVSTLVVLAALAAILLLAPGSRAVEHAFFSPRDMWQALVGDPRKVQAGTDCGFDTSAGMRRVAEDVVWAKLAALGEGARIASQRLF